MRLISPKSERPKSYPTSLTPRNFPILVLYINLNVDPKLYMGMKLASSVQRPEGMENKCFGSQGPQRSVVLQKILLTLTLQLFFYYDAD
jgi:hypothetical protein